jgi:hypothetical protein
MYTSFKFQKGIAFVIIVFAFLTSCQRDTFLVTPNQFDDKITIEEAKTYFKKYTDNQALMASGARKDGKPSKVKTPNWKKAVKRKKGSKEYIDIPLTYNSTWSLAKKGVRRLISFKEGGKINYHIMQIVGKDAYLEKTKGKLDEKFSGHITFYDLD